MASASAVLTASRIIGMTVGLAALNSWGINEFQQSQARDPMPAPYLGINIGDYIDRLNIWEHQSVETIMRLLSGFFLIAAFACLIAIIPSLFLFRRKSSQDTR